MTYHWLQPPTADHMASLWWLNKFTFKMKVCVWGGGHISMFALQAEALQRHIVFPWGRGVNVTHRTRTWAPARQVRLLLVTPLRAFVFLCGCKAKGSQITRPSGKHNEKHQVVTADVQIISQSERGEVLTHNTGWPWFCWFSILFVLLDFVDFLFFVLLISSSSSS